MHVHTSNCFCTQARRKRSRHRVDPTRTLSLRLRYERALSARFRRLAQRIREAIITDDALGLSLKVNAVPARAFDFPRTDQKISAFLRWLQTEMDTGILDISYGTPIGTSASRSWMNVYLDSAYQRGLNSAYSEMRGGGIGVAPTYIQGAFFQPVHADAIGIIYTRAYNDLRGVTSAMSTQMSRVLARALVEGRGVDYIARMLADRVDKIGIVRAKMIARTEVINAYAESTLNAYEQAGLDGVSLNAEFLTARDDKVCPKCSELAETDNGNGPGVFSIDEARGLIPVHPNCRCSWNPIIPSEFLGKVLR